jgi:hypothetical protein
VCVALAGGNDNHPTTKHDVDVGAATLLEVPIVGQLRLDDNENLKSTFYVQYVMLVLKNGIRYSANIVFTYDEKHKGTNPNRSTRLEENIYCVARFISRQYAFPLPDHKNYSGGIPIPIPAYYYRNKKTETLDSGLRVGFFLPEYATKEDVTTTNNAWDNPSQMGFNASERAVMSAAATAA